MNIFVNAASAHWGGAVTYLRSLLRFLPRESREHQYVVYLPKATREILQDSVDPELVQLHPYPFPSTSGVARHYFDQVLVPRLVRRHDCDVLVSTTGFGTFRSPRPQMLLVRNALYFVDVPTGGPSWANVMLRRWWSLASIASADMVVFPTAAMRDLVRPLASLDDSRARVIHYGFDRDEFFCSGGLEPDLLNQISAWKQSGRLVLLNVATYATHKNLETLVEALPTLMERGLDPVLVTTISPDKVDQRAAYERFQERVHELGLGHAVVQAGYLRHQQLAAVYRAADMFVFPSSLESFGHPLVEAMASGIPAVVSDTAVNREVCGDAAAYFATFDAAACAEAILTVALDADVRARLSSAGKERARSFSWAEYATHFVDLAESLHRQA